MTRRSETTTPCIQTPRIRKSENFAIKVSSRSTSSRVDCRSRRRGLVSRSRMVVRSSPPLCTRKLVLPRTKTSPSSSATALKSLPRTRTRLRLPPASTRGRPFTTETTQCRRETYGSLTRMEAASPRPIVRTPRISSLRPQRCCHEDSRLPDLHRAGDTDRTDGHTHASWVGPLSSAFEI